MFGYVTFLDEMAANLYGNSRLRLTSASRITIDRQVLKFSTNQHGYTEGFISRGQRKENFLESEFLSAVVAFAVSSCNDDDRSPRSIERKNDPIKLSRAEGDDSFRPFGDDGSPFRFLNANLHHRFLFVLTRHSNYATTRREQFLFPSLRDSERSSNIDYERRCTFVFPHSSYNPGVPRRIGRSVVRSFVRRRTSDYSLVPG